MLHRPTHHLLILAALFSVSRQVTCSPIAMISSVKQEVVRMMLCVRGIFHLSSLADTKHYCVDKAAEEAQCVGDIIEEYKTLVSPLVRETLDAFIHRVKNAEAVFCANLDTLIANKKCLFTHGYEVSSCVVDNFVGLYRDMLHLDLDVLFKKPPMSGEMVEEWISQFHRQMDVCGQRLSENCGAVVGEIFSALYNTINMRRRYDLIM